MKKILLFLVFMIVPVYVMAGVPQTKWILAIASQTVNAGAVIYSDPIEISNYENFGYAMINMSGSAGRDVKLDYQIIPSNQNSVYIASATAGAYEKSLGWIIPTTNGNLVSSLTSSMTWVADGFAPCVSRWLRLKVTGQNLNPADTTVTVYLSVYSER